MNWLEALPENRRRGSYCRCLLFMESDRRAVARRLTDLVGIDDVVIGENDFWAPQGIPSCSTDGRWNTGPAQEAKLGETEDLLSADDQSAITRWWLACPSLNSNTPNWDIASTCTIEGKKGFLLVEAKAHDQELIKEEKGKSLKRGASNNSRANHDQIGNRICQASAEFCKFTGLDWRLSRDSRYQMSNRFAWAWKLTDLGHPVVLVYLGFLLAGEMNDQGKPIADQADWERMVVSHSRPLFPQEVWGRRWKVNGQTFLSLIRALNQPLNISPGIKED